ncbi:MAG: hypothetical protein RL621_16 [Bacteroidota bacterium]
MWRKAARPLGTAHVIPLPVTAGQSLSSQAISITPWLKGRLKPGAGDVKQLFPSTPGKNTKLAPRQKLKPLSLPLNSM